MTVQKITNIYEALGFSCDGNTGTVSRKLILQASQQNGNSVQDLQLNVEV